MTVSKASELRVVQQGAKKVSRALMVPRHGGHFRQPRKKPRGDRERRCGAEGNWRVKQANCSVRDSVSHCVCLDQQQERRRQGDRSEARNGLSVPIPLCRRDRYGRQCFLERASRDFRSGATLHRSHLAQCGCDEGNDVFTFERLRRTLECAFRMYLLCRSIVSRGFKHCTLTARLFPENGGCVELEAQRATRPDRKSQVRSGVPCTTHSKCENSRASKLQLSSKAKCCALHFDVDGHASNLLAASLPREELAKLTKRTPVASARHC